MSLASLTYGLSIATILLFGVVALVLARRRQRVKKDDTEFFLTARHSVPERTIAWSFYAGGVGSWVIFSMPAYVVSAGIVGLVAYAVSCGLPILIMARVGAVLHRKYPNILSLGDFVRWRYGDIPMFIVTLVMLFNMSIGLCAEYTSIGNLMEHVIGAPRLYVSILTDVAQGVFGVTLLLVMYIYVAVTYRPASLPTPLPETLGPNYWGWAACGAMPISLVCSTVFSEGAWQRIWATADDRALKRGSIWGAMGLVITCFLYGFGGFLAIWAGFELSDPYGSTAFFDLLAMGKETAPTWVIIFAALATVTMNEGAVDSLQNAIVDTLASRFFRGKSVWYPRVLVFLINVPVVIVSLKGYDIIVLFLIGNLVCTVCAIPVLIGLVERLEGYVTSWSMVFGIITGFTSIVVFGYFKMGNIADGMKYVFIDSYDWPSFVLPLVFSLIGIFVAVAIEGAIRKACGLPFPVELSIPGEATASGHGNASETSSTADIEYAPDKFVQSSGQKVFQETK
ncbi:hypothetical protein BGZ94_000009 [Podila epigama]|nr:hypothetical protein BGZ94_000009 [Podila epigama]